MVGKLLSVEEVRDEIFEALEKRRKRKATEALNSREKNGL